MVERRARALLRRAASESERLQRHLLVAAALREVLDEPVVVGGTAEEFWTGGEYNPTDLDLCVVVDDERMHALGFQRRGRHWVRDDILVAVEIPAASIDRSMERTRLEPVAGGAARIIGLDDLYLDRLRQATIDERREGVEFASALAIVAARYEDLDRVYLGEQLAGIEKREPELAGIMRRIDRRVHQRVRRRLTDTE